MKHEDAIERAEKALENKNLNDFSRKAAIFRLESAKQDKAEFELKVKMTKLSKAGTKVRNANVRKKNGGE